MLECIIWYAFFTFSFLLNRVTIIDVSNVFRSNVLYVDVVAVVGRSGKISCTVQHTVIPYV